MDIYKPCFSHITALNNMGFILNDDIAVCMCMTNTLELNKYNNDFM